MKPQTQQNNFKKWTNYVKFELTGLFKAFNKKKYIVLFKAIYLIK